MQKNGKQILSATLLCGSAAQEWGHGSAPIDVLYSETMTYPTDGNRREVRNRPLLLTKWYLPKYLLHIRKRLEGSLKKLDAEYIDFYYQHRIDSKVEPEIAEGTRSPSGDCH